MSGPNEWQVTGQLSGGATLLEASAGTGKTYSITSLYARLVVEEGLSVQEILVVTFTRAATAELRDRIRRRLRDLAAALEAGAATDPSDQEIVDRFAQGSDALGRLRAAVEAFDQAQIYTIHAFCQRVLERFAFETGARFDATLLEDPSEILDEIVADFLSRERYASARRARFLEDTCKLGKRDATSLAKAVTDAREAELGPEVAPISAAEALGQWAAACEPFAAAWRDGGGAACRDFFESAAGCLSLSSYKPAQIASYLAKIEAGVADGLDLTEVAEGGTWVKNVRPDSLKPTGKSKATLPPVPAVLFEWERLVVWAQDHAMELVAGVRLQFAHTVRRELGARVQARNALTFADLLHLVSDRVSDRKTGGPLIAALRGAYKAALIDEFQDTDAVQWQIFGTVFGEPSGQGGRLFLIGDPKQAIYRFRGADIAVYERAKASTPEARRFTLTTNYRSDKPMVEAVNTLYADLDEAFVPRVDGQETFGYVRIAAKHERRYMPAATLDAGLAAPLSIRTFDGETFGTPGSTPSKKPPERLIPAFAAEDLTALLATGVSPRDIAVLVRKNKQARAMQAALRRRGVPSVIAAAGSVFESEEALWLERWLEALVSIDEASREGPARALAVTPLFGWRATDLLPRESASDGQADPGADPRAQRWIAWMKGLQAWRKRYESRGFVVAWNLALQEAGPSDADGPQRDAWSRLLTLDQGERHVTNLRHLAELAHAAQLRERMAPAALLHWLREQRDKGSDARDAAELRLETDADAVQIVTIHKAKGLQYPIVFLPFFWDGQRTGKAEDGVTRHRGQDGALRIDLGLDAASTRKKLLLEEAKRRAHEENLRLLYVALTRAQHQTVLYWGLAGEPRKSGSDNSPLAHVLHGHDDGSGNPRQMRGEARVRAAMKAGSLDELRPDLEALVERSEGTIACSAVARAETPSAYASPSGGTAAEALETAVYPHGGFDLAWRRMSYSGLAGHRKVEMLGARTDTEEAETDEPIQHDQRSDRAPSAPPDDGFDDAHEGFEAPDATPVPLSLRWPDGPAAQPDALTSPLLALPGGTEFGSWVHAILERLDFTTGRERAALGDGERLAGREAVHLAQDQARRNGLRDAVREGKPLSEWLCEALPLVVQTPLGGPLGDVTLSDIDVKARLDELTFDFAVGGGTQAKAGHGVLEARVHAALLMGTPPGLDADTWRRVVEATRFGTLRGVMTGSLDLVFRHEGRYYVADYKTNRIAGLPPPEGTRAVSTPGHYDEPWLAIEMARHNYYLQYHLYLVALHRFLGTRLRTYDYDDHVGGAYYLFLRGMVGESARRDGSRVRGVYHHRPDRAVIEALSACFDTMEPAPPRPAKPAQGTGGNR